MVVEEDDVVEEVERDVSMTEEEVLVREVVTGASVVVDVVDVVDRVVLEVCKSAFGQRLALRLENSPS